MNHVEKARKLRPLMVKAAQSLDDKDASEALELYGICMTAGDTTAVTFEATNFDILPDDVGVFTVKTRNGQTDVKAVHITELQNVMNDILLPFMGVTAVTFTKLERDSDAKHG